MSTTTSHDGITLQFDDGGEVRRHGQIIGYIDPTEGTDAALFLAEPGFVEFAPATKASLDDAIDYLVDCWRRFNTGDRGDGF